MTLVPDRTEDRSQPPIEGDWERVRRWRVSQRKVLIAERLALPLELRRRTSRLVLEKIREYLPHAPGAALGVYWPFRGEIDVRGLADGCLENDGRFALPVVVEKSAPLEFRSWWPGMKLARGVWNIPVPAVREIIVPEVLIVPLLGYDPSGFRLGYGGGYYDRTLAAMRPRPFTIGVGYACGRLASIVPQPHDIGMDVIVTERGVSCFDRTRTEHG